MTWGSAPPPRGSVAGRDMALRAAGPAVASQVLNSGSTLLTMALLVHALAPEEFGRVSIVLVLGFLLVAASRSWTVDPTARLLSAAGERVGRQLPAGFDRSLAQACTLVGTVTAGLCGALRIAPRVSAGLVVLGVLTTAYDSMRAGLLLNHRSLPCLLGDGAWLVTQIGAVAAVSAVSGLSAGAVVFAACVGAASGIVAIRRPLRLVPRAGSVGAASAERASWMLEQLLGGGLLPFSTVALAATAGYTGSAAFRAALLLMGPATVLVGGLRQPALGWLSRVPRTVARRTTRRLAAATAVLSAAVTVPTLAVPASIGHSLLSDLWEPARQLLPAVIVQRIAGSASEVFVAANRAFGTPARALSSRAALVALVVAAASVAGRAGPSPAAWMVAGISAAWILVYDKIAVDDRDGPDARRTGGPDAVAPRPAEPRPPFGVERATVLTGPTVLRR